MKTILPVRPRSGGAIFDMYVSNPDINTGYPFEEIVVPVLIINARDDPLTLYTNALAMAEKIPHARFLTIENGGHMLLGHQATVRSQITSFWRNTALSDHKVVSQTRLIRRFAAKGTLEI